MAGADFVFWNWSVVVYLFLAGISAGALAISTFAYLLSPEKHRTIIRLGAFVAPFPLIAGLLCLIYDLERPQLFWKLMTTFRATSVMSLGSWLLVLFSVLSFVNLYLWLPDRFDIAQSLLNRGWGSSRTGRLFMIRSLLSGMRRDGLLRLRGPIAVVGIPVALLVGIYTGVLLSVLAARPFWNNPMLPMLFLVSALKTGMAAICMAGWFNEGIHEQKIHETRFVRSVDSVLIALSVVAIALYVFGLYASPESAARAPALIMGGKFTVLFWGAAVVIGILVPLSYKVYEFMPGTKGTGVLMRHHGLASGFVTGCALLGGFYLRYVIVYAGQAVGTLIS
jgi:formate-dependent nitrite reductase membrane component NrfD